jgi:hypothetical protein
MTCIHLKEINRVCEDSGLKLGRTDLIRVVCKECGDQEVCPANSIEMDEPSSEGGRSDSNESSRTMNVHVESSAE